MNKTAGRQLRRRVGVAAFRPTPAPHATPHTISAAVHPSVHLRSSTSPQQHISAAVQQYSSTSPQQCPAFSAGARALRAGLSGAVAGGSGATCAAANAALSRVQHIPRRVVVQRYAAWSMSRPRLNLDAIDAALQTFDRLHGIVEDDGTPCETLPWRSRGADATPPGGAADDQEDFGATDLDGDGDPCRSVGQARSPLRRRRLRIARTLDWGIRPSDLPPLTVLPGYLLDHRRHWRYRLTGRRVPGARHRTLNRLWDLGRYDPVLVPCLLSGQASELAWCAAVGVLEETRYAGRSVAAWRVDADDWDDRARYSLGMDAPELAADRLLGVGDVAAILGVGASTVTSYLSRGRLPEPQVRLSGRPAWTAPVLLAALAARH
jgi:predicted DNA-binding transcriptional regulator AlpA